MTMTMPTNTPQRSLADAAKDPSATKDVKKTPPAPAGRGSRLTWGMAAAIWVSGVIGGLVLSRFLPVRWRRW
jgi:hypothetical protein